MWCKLLNQICFKAVIVFLRFSPKLDNLFSNSSLFSMSQQENSSSSSSTTQSTTSNTSNILDVSILDLCRYFVNRCLAIDTIDKKNSFKLASMLVDFMSEVAPLVNLKPNDFTVLFKWTQNILTEEVNGDILFVKSVLNLFYFTTWNKNSSVALIKYF